LSQGFLLEESAKLDLERLKYPTEVAKTWAKNSVGNQCGFLEGKIGEKTFHSQ